MVDLVPSLLMDIIAWDTPVWGYLISVFNDFIGNFGWTIIVITILLKIILIPLDYFQRKATKQNMEIQKVMAPEIEKVKAKYANVPNIMQQKIQEKQMEIYKKNNYNLAGFCVVMLLNMVITVVVFLTLFNCLNQVANIQTTNMYTSFSIEYNRVYEETGNEEDAKNAVLAKYDDGEVVQNWLWVKNLWRADSSVSPIPNYNDFITMSRYSSDSENENYLSEEDYIKVMQPIMDKEKGWNGYYILSVLAFVIMFLSMTISSGGFKKKGQQVEDQSVKMNGVLRFVLPLIVLLITLFSNAVFALYVIANSLFVLCTTPIYNKILKRKDDNKSNSGKKDDDLVVDYRIQKNTIIKD